MKHADLNWADAAASRANRRHFSVAQANRALVLVKRIVADVVAGYGRLLDLHETIEAAQRRGHHRRFELAREDMVRCAEKLRNCLGELEAVGVELRDWSQGIVDFPCRLAQRLICLCWRHGEPTIEHWHEVGEGFPQRRPIAQLEAWELLAPARR